MKFTCNLVIAVLLLVMSNVPSSAQNAPASALQGNPVALAQQVKDDMLSMIASQVDLTDDVKQKNARDAVSRIAATINLLKVGTLTPENAKWIYDSFIDLAKQDAEKFASNDDADRANIKALEDQATRRFSNLDNSKEKKLLDESHDLITSAEMYERDLRTFMVARFSKFKIVALNLGQPNMNGLMETSLGGVLVSLNGVPTVSVKFDSRKDLDVRDKVTESELISYALARQLDLELKRDEITDRMSFGNLFSRVFDDGDPVGVNKLLTFQQMSSVIDDIYHSCVTTKGDITSVDFPRVRRFLIRATNIRRDKALPPDRSEQTQPIRVTFVNDQTAWKALTPKNL